MQTDPGSEQVRTCRRERRQSEPLLDRMFTRGHHGTYWLSSYDHLSLASLGMPTSCPTLRSDLRSDRALAWAHSPAASTEASGLAHGGPFTRVKLLDARASPELASTRTIAGTVHLVRRFNFRERAHRGAAARPALLRPRSYQGVGTPPRRAERVSIGLLLPCRGEAPARVP